MEVSSTHNGFRSRQARRDSRSQGRSKAQSYPRKRALMACDVCRVRKTRCNAAKPSCSFCEGLNIECVYSKAPNVINRPSKLEQKRDARNDASYSSSSMAAVLDRLDKLEATLEAMPNRSLTGERPQRLEDGMEPSVDLSTGVSTSSTLHLNPLACDGYWPGIHTTDSSPQRLRLHSFKVPSLLLFETVSPHYRPWAYNFLQQFYADQVKSVSDMSLNLRTMSTLPPSDLSRRHVLRLQQAFVASVLRLFPFVDRETCLEQTKSAEESGYQAIDSSVCFALLMYAVGSCAQESAPLYQVDSSQLPGFSYFAKAMTILETLSLSSPLTDISLLQCHILTAFYYLFNVRQLQAHRHVSRACQDIIFIIRGGLHQGSPEYSGAFGRIFWTCWLLENELELCLDLPPCGIRLYENMIPLPTSRYDEEGMYNLLAMVSLRRLTANLNELAGYAASPSARYGSVIAKELLEQLKGWHTHLPSPLKFPPNDESLLFNLRKAYLRCLFHFHRAILLWPPLAVRLGLKHHESNSVDTELVDDQDVSYGAASDCLAAARAAIKTGEEVLSGNSIVLHLALRGYFAMAMILLLAHPAPEQNSDLQDDRLIIRHAHGILSQWKAIPFLKPALAKMEEIMDAKGISWL